MRTKTLPSGQLHNLVAALRDYPLERWRRRTVRNVLLNVADTRRQLLAKLDAIEASRAAEHAELVEILRSTSTSKLEQSDFPAAFLYLHERVQPFALVSIECDYALYEGIRHIVAAGIPGDIVECGVWAGGSSTLAALTLTSLGARRRMWLYDTYSDFPHPGKNDEFYAERQQQNEPYSTSPSLDQVKSNMAGTGQEDVVYVEGLVEDTIPATAPDQIALLRLDTDWYESTRHGLRHLYPRLSEGGVLIIDDYGHFQGARRAIDEYFQDRPVLLNRIDYTGRLIIKPASHNQSGA